MDNRKVERGNLFVAMKGSSADGHDFISDAISRGAAVVVGDRDLAGLAVPYIRVENSRRALTWLAAAFYGNPGHSLTVIGITGTDGKTTTSNLLYQILIAAGIKAGMISTVNAIIGDEILDTGFHVTTPDAPDVQFYLAKMVGAGLTHVILETTSHGLAQHRVDASQYDVAVITNITHEHLDEHGSFENYQAAKGRLIHLLAETREKVQGNPRLAVLNRDEPSFTFLHTLVQTINKKTHLTETCYGLNPTADVRAESILYSPEGIHFNVVSRDFQVQVRSPLVGQFNVSNCLAAMAVAARGLCIDPQVAAQGIAKMAGVPGRMERIAIGQDFTAIVDFAHTPNALRVAIETARGMLSAVYTRYSALAGPGKPVPLHEPRVITIFGSAGLRDKEKRHMMAETSAELADISIFTAEDPRTESLEGILDEMAAGAKSRGGVEGTTFFCIPDRGEAIRQGIQMARRADIVLVCGKGHEQSMCFGKVEYPWDDRMALRAALSELMGIRGPKMPVLPTQVQK